MRAQSINSNRLLYYPLAIAVTATVSSLILTGLIGLNGFRAIPYVRTISVMVCSLFLMVFFIGARLRLNINKGLLFKGVIALQVLSVAYLMIGLFRSNNIMYLVTDLIYLTIFFLTFLYGACAFRKHSRHYTNEKFAKLIILLFFLLAVVSPLKIYPATELLMLWTCALIICIAQKNRLQTLLLLLVIIPQLPGVNRAFILTVSLAFVLLFFSSKLSRKIKITAASLIVAAALSATFIGTDVFSGTNLERRINETMYLAFKESQGDLPIPIQQRFYEGELIFRDIGESIIPISILFGMGHGYTLDMTHSLDSAVISSQLLGGGDTHNIHFLHYALLARFGMLGVAVFSFIFIFAISRSFTLLKKTSQNENNLELIASLYISLLFVFSVPASSFLFSSMVLGYFCGIASEAYGPKVVKIQEKQIVKNLPSRKINSFANLS